jgi:hypothetical protein
MTRNRTKLHSSLPAQGGPASCRLTSKGEFNAQEETIQKRVLVSLLLPIYKQIFLM